MTMPLDIRHQLEKNLHGIRGQIESACQRVGRDSNEVKLIAVTKYAELEWVRELVGLGVVHLGESRPQQLIARAAELSSQIKWHMIGHLQRNKAEDLLPVATLIHSVDSLRLFDHLAKIARSYDRPPKVLLEVNVSAETSKDGFAIDQLQSAWKRMRDCDSLEIAGLMTMAPLDDNPEAARPVFRRLREIRDELRTNSDGRFAMSELSMGMSGDFEIGIEEGATLVRIGSRLFEGLKPAE